MVFVFCSSRSKTDAVFERVLALILVFDDVKSGVFDKDCDSLWDIVGSGVFEHEDVVFSVCSSERVETLFELKWDLVAFRVLVGTAVFVRDAADDDAD